MVAPRRPLTDWELRAVVDGWDNARYWKSPSYLADAPYPAADVRAGFDMVRKIMDRDHVSEQIQFADDTNSLSWVTAALCDPFRADVGPLLPFALDLLDGRVDQFPELVASLREPNHFDHRATVEVVAGLARVGIAHTVEPWAASVNAEPGRHPNPDLLVDFGARLPWEVKRLHMSQRAVRALERFQTVLHGPNLSKPTPIGLAAEFLPLFTTLERGVEREARFDRFCAVLNLRARERAEHMRRFGIQESTVGNVLRLHLRDPSECTFFGPTLEHPDDAQRAKEPLDKASGQLDDRHGMIVLMPDATMDIGDLVDFVDLWLQGPDHHVLGVVIIHDVLAPGFDVLLRAPLVRWRLGLQGRAARTQRAVQRGPWQRFFVGLNARRMQLESWRRLRSAPSAMTEDVIGAK